MFCKKCGYKLDDNASFCPFCKQVVEGKENQAEYKNIFEREEDITSLRKANGYVNLNSKWWHHLLIGCGAYLLMDVLASIFTVIYQFILVEKGYNLDCLPDGKQACEVIGNLEAFETYYKGAAAIQLACELLMVGVVILLFRKHIGKFFKTFKDKKTLKWYGLSFAMMYGANTVYSIVLMALEMVGIKAEVNANQAAVNDIIFGSPLLGFLFVVIAAPLFEEVVFRFGIFRSFTFKDKKNEIIGLILTTIAFAGIHMIATFSSAIITNDIGELVVDWKLIGNDMLSLPVYLIGAFFITFSYFKSKSFATPILMHMTWNLMSYIANIMQQNGSI